MSSRRQHLKNTYKTAMPASVVSELWTDDFKAEFQPNSKNLYRQHRVPKISWRQLSAQ